MSMRRMRRRRLPSFRAAKSDPKLCAQIFGGHIRHCRELDGRPIEELAPWSGLSPAEWVAMEAGEQPLMLEHVLLLATVLNLGDSWLAVLLSLFAGTQQQN